MTKKIESIQGRRIFFISMSAVLIILFHITILNATNPDILDHPEFGPATTFLEKVKDHLDRFGLSRIDAKDNCGQNPIKVIYDAETKIPFAVCKLGGKVYHRDRAKLEPLVYQISRKSGLNCVVPAYLSEFNGRTYNIERFVQFCDKESPIIPDEVRNFGDYFSTNNAVVTTAFVLKEYTDENRNLILKYLDSQSMQEIGLFQLLCNSDDVNAKNIALRYCNDGKLRFYVFDHEFAMDIYPQRGNQILREILHQPLSDKSIEIILGWEDILQDHDLLEYIDDVCEPITRRYEPGIILKNSAFFKARITAIINFVKRNKNVNFADLFMFSFIGSPYPMREMHLDAEYAHRIHSFLDATMRVKPLFIENSVEDEKLYNLFRVISNASSYLVWFGKGYEGIDMSSSDAQSLVISQHKSYIAKLLNSGIREDSQALQDAMEKLNLYYPMAN
ncbi:MAG: hypothetical protein Q8L85_10380 [Alphaproteobacteria bacterium]|nr:hypothetical protein [Alphaproteobacteria bacterium]